MFHSASETVLHQDDVIREGDRVRVIHGDRFEDFFVGDSVFVETNEQGIVEGTDDSGQFIIHCDNGEIVCIPPDCLQKVL